MKIKKMMIFAFAVSAMFSCKKNDDVSDPNLGSDSFRITEEILKADGVDSTKTNFYYTGQNLSKVESYDKDGENWILTKKSTIDYSTSAFIANSYYVSGSNETIFLQIKGTLQNGNLIEENEYSYLGALQIHERKTIYKYEGNIKTKEVVINGLEITDTLYVKQFSYENNKLSNCIYSRMQDDNKIVFETDITYSDNEYTSIISLFKNDNLTQKTKCVEVNSNDRISNVTDYHWDMANEAWIEGTALQYTYTDTDNGYNLEISPNISNISKTSKYEIGKGNNELFDINLFTQSY